MCWDRGAGRAAWHRQRGAASSGEGCVQPAEEREYWGGTGDPSKEQVGNNAVHQQGKVV